MTPRAKAPESARAWSACWASGDLHLRTFSQKYEAADWYQARPVRVRIIKEQDYRRLLRAAAGKREAKR